MPTPAIKEAENSVLEDVLYRARSVHSLLDDRRLENLWTLTREAVRESHGVVVEFGSYRGGSALVLAAAIGEEANQLHLFDTFAGMPETGPNDGIVKGYLADVKLEEVRQMLPLAMLHVGDFRELKGLPNWPEIAFAHIDVDLESSTAKALWLCWPKLQKGGWIVVDDYDHDRCNGCKLAVDGFVKQAWPRPLMLYGANPSVLIQKS